MPTVTTIDSYRFYFYSSDAKEPAHIHAKRERFTAKFWLNPIRLQKSKGFSDHELIKIQKLIEKNKVILQEKWYEYFGT
ncbi:MAG: DUF4160 domain-containing protein [Candidatus Scalindua sp. AMX11]|nr:MAG: DUF4160 domain-containing protein [Candidatus Scalindua sp.]NOG82973.1 DUF4160 domain-containing protein [Planctomycetota bacterium]RZV68053.1 MAG: DUF4160 domain-containing protein [Candidatus Scalindua sp. SCAELEC01]TDE63745.1 MAG: DUF4160 domain-containing protein [Candidatus Scalindua sp. AMX11]GJQ60472.1 MAG: hypothetical protein SCALA701_32730 [Candidatus Scalindua sp.]